MYKQHFGLNENPFSITPDPRYLYLSERHQEALALLFHGIASDNCIVLLTGEVGTGKTTVCRRFLEGLDETVDVAVIINPKLNADELLSAICREFKISSCAGKPSTRQLLEQLNEFLLAGHARNRQALLIVDEAQHLEADVLEMLRLLTNLETDRQKLLKIVLLGQSELAIMLTSPQLRQINQRITSRYHLQGLRRKDLAGYLQHRIRVAGGEQSRLFSNRAITRIFYETGGIPRLINSLCDRALLGAFSTNNNLVSQRIVKQAARELFAGTVRTPPRFRPSRLMTGLALAAGILATALLILGLPRYLNSPERTKSAEVSAGSQEPSTEDGSHQEEEPNDPLLQLAGQEGEYHIEIGPIQVSGRRPRQ